jgi:hypothetical protein
LPVLGAKIKAEYCNAQSMKVGSTRPVNRGRVKVSYPSNAEIRLRSVPCHRAEIIMGSFYVRLVVRVWSYGRWVRCLERAVGILLRGGAGGEALPYLRL